MSVFQLYVFSCVTFSAFGANGSYTKTCDWRAWGELRKTLASCEVEATKQKGKPIFSDVMDGRTIEETKCVSTAVLD